MNINFKSELYQALLARANTEKKAIPTLVTEILESVLISEEKQNDKSTTAHSTKS